jgi:hypothetical protein
VTTAKITAIGQGWQAARGGRRNDVAADLLL